MSEHLVADWPGYFPNGPEIVRLLIDAGADPNALTTSRGSQTPVRVLKRRCITRQAATTPPAA